MSREKELRDIFRKLSPNNQSVQLVLAQATLVAQENTEQAMRRQYGLDAAGYETESDPVVSEPARV